MRNRQETGGHANRPMHRPGYKPVVNLSQADGLEGIVTGKEFITSVPAEGYRHVLSCGLTKKIGGNQRTVTKRFIQLPDDLRKHQPGVFHGKNFIMVIGMKGSGDHFSIFGLVETGLMKSDGKGFKPPLRDVSRC